MPANYNSVPKARNFWNYISFLVDLHYTWHVRIYILLSEGNTKEYMSHKVPPPGYCILVGVVLVFRFARSMVSSLALPAVIYINAQSLSSRLEHKAI